MARTTPLLIAGARKGARIFDADVRCGVSAPATIINAARIFYMRRGTVAAPKGPAASPAWKTWLESACVLVFYLAVMLLCLRQWDSPAPWSRLDLFSGGYMVLGMVLFAQQSVFAARFTGSQEIRTAFYSLEIDPEFSRWSAILGLLGTLAFLDYAHWHLCPALDRTAVKTVGLIL